MLHMHCALDPLLVTTTIAYSVYADIPNILQKAIVLVVVSATWTSCFFSFWPNFLIFQALFCCVFRYTCGYSLFLGYTSLIQQLWQLFYCIFYVWYLRPKQTHEKYACHPLLTYLWRDEVSTKSPAAFTLFALFSANLSFTSSGIQSASPKLNLNSAFVFTLHTHEHSRWCVQQTYLFTFWPPAPLDREKLKVRRSLGIIIFPPRIYPFSESHAAVSFLSCSSSSISFSVWVDCVLGQTCSTRSLHT